MTLKETHTLIIWEGSAEKNIWTEEKVTRASRKLRSV
jgi:hypothetical protein